MRVAVGSDEVTSLTDRVVADLRAAGHEVELLGPLAGGSGEWVEVSAAVARRVAEGDCEKGVVCCWSGTGASIAANKVPGARAALCADAETARMARKYNHANVLALSLRATSDTLGAEILAAFLDEPLGDEEFDRRNVAEVEALDAARREGTWRSRG
jgi:ribose 5-phosphate isomerase B